jgi:O-antigen/teichoic acid export membrane protein
MNVFSDNLKVLISSSGLNFLFRIIGLGTSFLIVFIISNLFGIENYGNFSLIFTITQAIAMIFALGIPNALILLIGNKNLSNREAKVLLFKGIKITLILSILPIIVLFFGAEFIATSVFNSSNLILFLKMGAVTIPFFIIHELFLYYFIAIKRFLTYNIFMFGLPNLLLGIFLFLFYVVGKTDFYTFLAFTISIIILVIAEFVVTYEAKLSNIENTIPTKKLIKTASPMMFSGLLLFLLNWTDVIMLGMLVDEAQVGIYNIAYKIGSVGFLVIVSVSTFITPKMAELYGKGAMEELKKLIHNATRLILILSVPLVSILVIFSKFILSFFGTLAITGSATLIIVAIGVLFSAISGNVDQILNMTNHQKILKNITIVCFLVNVTLNYILIPIYGINGAAIASLVSNIVINVLCIYYIKKKLGFYTLF